MWELQNTCLTLSVWVSCCLLTVLAIVLTCCLYVWQWSHQSDNTQEQENTDDNGEWHIKVAELCIANTLTNHQSDEEGCHWPSQFIADTHAGNTTYSWIHRTENGHVWIDWCLQNGIGSTTHETCNEEPCQRVLLCCKDEKSESCGKDSERQSHRTLITDCLNTMGCRNTEQEERNKGCCKQQTWSRTRDVHWLL